VSTTPLPPVSCVDLPHRFHVPPPALLQPEAIRPHLYFFSSLFPPVAHVPPHRNDVSTLPLPRVSHFSPSLYQAADKLQPASIRPTGIACPPPTPSHRCHVPIFLTVAMCPPPPCIRRLISCSQWGAPLRRQCGRGTRDRSMGRCQWGCEWGCERSMGRCQWGCEWGCERSMGGCEWGCEWGCERSIGRCGWGCEWGCERSMDRCEWGCEWGGERRWAGVKGAVTGAVNGRWAGVNGAVNGAVNGRWAGVNGAMTGAVNGRWAGVNGAVNDAVNGRWAGASHSFLRASWRQRQRDVVRGPCGGSREDGGLGRKGVGDVGGRGEGGPQLLHYPYPTQALAIHSYDRHGGNASAMCLGEGVQDQKMMSGREWDGSGVAKGWGPTKMLPPARLRRCSPFIPTIGTAATRARCVRFSTLGQPPAAFCCNPPAVPGIRPCPHPYLRGRIPMPYFG
jgi:hypothetical protein